MLNDSVLPLTKSVMYNKVYGTVDSRMAFIDWGEGAMSLRTPKRNNNIYNLQMHVKVDPSGKIMLDIRLPYIQPCGAMTCQVLGAVGGQLRQDACIFGNYLTP